jgi:hypothetical protein
MLSFNKFGISKININGTSVHTYKIRVCNTEDNRNILLQYGFPVPYDFSPQKYIVLQDTIIDYNEAERTKITLMAALRDIAENTHQIKMRRKYGWIEEQLNHTKRVTVMGNINH